MPLTRKQHIITGEFFSGSGMDSAVDQVASSLRGRLDDLPEVRIVSLNVYSRGTSTAPVAYVAVVEELS